MLKILHAADLHLDSAISGRSQGATARLRAALRSVPHQISQLCRKERCDLLLLAGDVFDGPHTPETLRELKLIIFCIDFVELARNYDFLSNFAFCNMFESFVSRKNRCIYGFNRNTSVLYALN